MAPQSRRGFQAYLFVVAVASLILGMGIGGILHSLADLGCSGSSARMDAHMRASPR